MLDGLSLLIMIAVFYCVLGETSCSWNKDTSVFVYKYTGRGFAQGTLIEIEYDASDKTKEDNK